MDLRSLELFISLAGTLHFGRTSEEQHVSPSALSRHIQRLENALGTRLFVRNNRSVTLTQQGQQALQSCQSILAEWQQLQMQLADDGELKGKLRLFCSVTAAQTFMRQFIEGFRPNYPHVALSVDTGDPALALEHVLRQQTDIAIATRPEQVPDGVLMHQLYTSPLVMIRPKTTCAVREKTLAGKIDWNDMPIVVAQMGLSRERLFTWFEAHRQQPRVYAEVAGHEAIVAMVGLGLAVGLVPEVVVEQSSIRDQIEVFLRPRDIEPYHVSLCCLKKRLQDPVIAAFWHSAVG